MGSRITLVGFGLLAGSIAMAVKQAKLPIAIRAVSSKNTLARAKELSLADEFFEYGDTENWAKNSDLILLCSPIKHILETVLALKSIAPALGDEEIIVSDIGSTKEEICRAGFELPKPFCFVGGHPMAGSEKKSVEHSDPAMFENAYWLYCLSDAISTDENSPAELAGRIKPQASRELPKVLSDLLLFLGSRPVKISPIEHDFAMSYLSHAPQLISTAMASGISPSVAEKNLHLAGRGFRDMTRIAGSSWGMWKDILETNRENVIAALAEYAEKILEIKTALADAASDNISTAKLSSAKLENIFLAGNKTRHSLETGKNYAYPLYEIVVQIPDEAGSILKILSPISEQNINIRDIELMKVREGIGGALLLSFKQESEADNALSILEKIGIPARKRV